MGFEPLSMASKPSVQAQTQWCTLHVGENTRLCNFNHLFPANFPIASQKRFLPIPVTPVFFVFLTKLGETTSPSCFQLCDCWLGSGLKSVARDNYGGD